MCSTTPSARYIDANHFFVMQLPRKYTEVSGAGSCFTVADLCIFVITIPQLKNNLRDQSVLLSSSDINNFSSI
jgi:hypothetical protein